MMVRSITNLLKLASAGVRESASCIIVQKIANGNHCFHNVFDYRLLFVKRHQKLKSWPGALTFPGGVIDRKESESVKNFSQVTNIDKFTASAPSDIENVYRKTAVRELIEETEFPLTIAINTLIPWSIWQTPLSIPRRFNTIFYLVFVDTNELSLCPREGEIESLHWHSPAEVLKDSSVNLAPVTVADVSKFHSFPCYDQLKKFAKQRYNDYQTVQCMPVIVRLKDGLIGVNPNDSFYSEALELQLEDKTQLLSIDSTIEEFCEGHEVLCREIISSKDGKRKIISSSLWDGHSVSDELFQCKIMSQ